MSTLLQKIKDNLVHLPSKDLKFANKFIDERNFESLYELVSADHKIHDKKRNKDGLFDNEKDSNIEEHLCELEGDVLSYLRCIEPDYEIINDDDCDSDCFLREDFD